MSYYLCAHLNEVKLMKITFIFFSLLEQAIQKLLSFLKPVLWRPLRNKKFSVCDLNLTKNNRKLYASRRLQPLLTK